MLRIEIEKLAIGERVLAADAEYALARGSTHLLRGPNGCGKSLLLDTICGIHASPSVTIAIDDRSVGRGAYRRWRAGVRRQAQAPVLAPNLAAAEVVERAFRNGSVPERWREQCLSLLDAANIESQRAVGTHSFGQQRLLEFVFAIASGDWHLLDEPFAGIASAHVGSVAALIAAASAEGRGVLLVDHTGTEIARAIVHDWPKPKDAVVAEPGDHWVLDAPRDGSDADAWRVRSIAAGNRMFLRDVTIATAPGQFTVLRGSNGTGKSTILRSLARQSHPFDVVESIEGGARDVHLSPQPPKLVGELRVRANLELMGVPSKTVTEFVARALQRFGLAPTLLARRAESLSGGEAAAVALIGAIASRAPVLLLDEPVESLSPSAISAAIGLLKEALRTGRCVVAATHTDRLRDELATGTVIDLRSYGT